MKYTRPVLVSFLGNLIYFLTLDLRQQGLGKRQKGSVTKRNEGIGHFPWVFPVVGALARRRWHLWGLSLSLASSRSLGRSAGEPGCVHGLVPSSGGEGPQRSLQPCGVQCRRPPSWQDGALLLAPWPPAGVRFICV